MASVRAKNELQNSHFLRILGENATLKAGVQLLQVDPESLMARRTVADQLRDISGTMGVDFVLLSDPSGRSLAGVTRIGGQVVSMDMAAIRAPQRGFLTVAGQPYQIASTPIRLANKNIGILSIGEPFDLSNISTPAVLLDGGKVLKSSIPNIRLEEVGKALQECSEGAECEIRLGNQTYLSLPVESMYFGKGYTLRSLQSIDTAMGPVQTILRNVFLIAGIGTLMATVILTIMSSRSIVRPIAGVVSHLRETEQTGVLPEFQPNAKLSPIHEIRELTESFNHAARAIREGRENLQDAYVEFIEALANALDARDRYTAGHSRRVSEFSCAIARELNVDTEELEEIRIGALLHDIGKIGIGDGVLQKDGRLTAEEMALIQQHPTIGRRILEGVGGFQIYLATVELHHENWDGTGYPNNLRGEETPLSARIVHVADAYDAMTSDRPYRRAMSHEKAIEIVQQNAGTQFDPAIVLVFSRVMGGAAAGEESIHKLSVAVNENRLLQPAGIRET